MKKLSIACLMLALQYSCSNNNEQKTAIKGTDTTKNTSVVTGKEPKQYAVGTTDEAIAKKIEHFLLTDYLKDDLKVMDKEDRKFQFQTVDLNNDGRQELFIKFVSRYFCGTGGCTLLLIDSNWALINKFIVAQTPIMIEPHRRNKWALLMVKDGEDAQGNALWKELEYKNGKYPSNPSVLQVSKMSPSGHAQIVFSDELAPAKIFEF